MRRQVIADAAIATLAAEGSRGLTHRAVDRVAGLPEGSTSYYLRTRASLLAAIVDRLAELDAAIVPAAEIARADQKIEPADPAGALDAMVREALAAGRDRLVARYELSLEASRRPELREALERGERALRTRLATLFTVLGAEHPDRAARDALTLLDGVLLAEAVGTGPARSPAEVSDLVRRVVAACGVPGSARPPS